MNRQQQRKIPIILIFLVGFFLSTFSSFLVYRYKLRADQASFKRQAEVQIRTIGETLRMELASLTAITSFFYASHFVDRLEFSTFTQTLFQGNPGIHVLQWVPRVEKRNRAAFETSVRQEEVSEFFLKERDSQGGFVNAVEREDYYPVLYANPHRGNEMILGYDLGSDPVIRGVMKLAASSATMRATPMMAGLRNEKKEATFLVANPIYKKESLYGTKEHLLENIAGFAVGEFRVAEVMRKSLELYTGRDIDFTIWDSETLNQGDPIFTSTSTTIDPKRILSEKNVPKKFISLWQIEVAGRVWNVACSFKGRNWYSSLLWEPLAVFFAGLFFTLMLVWYMTLITVRSLRNEALNRQLEQTNRELEKANMELDSFVYTASHDLSSPLRSIASFADLLEERIRDKLTDKEKDFFLRIKRGAERMSSLIDDLLTLSRVSRIRNPYESVRMLDLIKTVLQKLEFEVERLKIDLHVQENMPVVYCDRIKLELVFFNLISNAIKFSSKENQQRPRVEVTASETPQSYVFSVRDNGIGIEPEYHEEIFKIFRRLHTREEYEGTGAGLNIVKRIVEEHAGRVWVESAKGKGSNFFFSISKKLRRP